MKRDDGVMRIQPAGEIISYMENGKLIRKERTVIDGATFYRYSVNKDLAGEYRTFWSTDEGMLRRLIEKRVK